MPPLEGEGEGAAAAMDAPKRGRGRPPKQRAANTTPTPTPTATPTPAKDDPVARCFHQSQQASASRDRLVASLVAVLAQNPPATKPSFARCVDLLLVQYKREPGTERAVDLAVKTCGALVAQARATPSETNADLEAFVLDLLASWVTRSAAKDKAVRLRATQMLGALLASLPDDYDGIDDATFEDMERCVMLRLTDKIPAVRVEAVKASERLQDPSDKHDPFTLALLKAAKFDPSKHVRRAAVRTMCLAPHTLPDMCASVRDEADEVRAAALHELASRAPIKSVPLALRLSVMDQALRDRAKPVRSAAVSLLKTWLGQCGKSLTALLEMMDVEANEDVAVSCVTALLEANAVPSANVDGATTLADAADTPESALVLRVRAQRASSSASASATANDTTAFDALVPDAATLVDVVEARAKVTAAAETLAELRRGAFVLRQLLHVVACYDADRTDQHTQNRLQDAVASIATDVDVVSAWRFPDSLDMEEDKLTDVACTALRASFGRSNGSEAHFLTRVVGAASAGYASEEADAEKEVEEEENATPRAQLQRALGELTSVRARKAEHVAKEEYAEAAALKRVEGELEARVADLQAALGSATTSVVEAAMSNPEARAVAATRRGVLLACGALRNSRRGMRAPQIAGLLQHVIQPALTNADAATRRAAMDALGMFSTMDEASAREVGIPVLRACLATDGEDASVRTAAVKAACDALMVLGPSALAAGDTDAVAAEWEAMLAAFMSHLESPNADATLAAAQALAKLLITGRVQDARVLQCLLVLLFHPSSNDDPRLRQSLSVFFGEFVRGSGAGDANRALVMEMAVPVLRAVLHPAKNSMCEDISASEVCHYLAYLLCAPAEAEAVVNVGAEEASSTPPRPRNYHALLAECILREIVVDPAHAAVADLIKTLASLSLADASQASIKRARAVLEDVQRHDRVQSRVAVKTLERLSAAWAELDSTPAERVDKQTRAELDAEERAARVAMEGGSAEVEASVMQHDGDNDSSFASALTDGSGASGGASNSNVTSRRLRAGGKAALQVPSQRQQHQQAVSPLPDVASP